MEASTQSNRLITIEEAASQIPSGAILALGGLTLYRRPVAFVRALLQRFRQTGEPHRLTLLNFTAGLESDLLVGAGMVQRIRTCYFGLEIFGLAPMFTYYANRGEIDILEETEASLAYERPGSTGWVVERNDALVWAGKVAISVTGALGEASDTLASAISVSVVASAAITEAADRLNSAVGTGISAAAAIVERQDTVAADGTVATPARIANAALVEAGDGLTASGTVAVLASVAVIEAGDIVVSGVSVLVTGSFSKREDDDTLDGFGSQNRYGDANLLERNDVLSSSVYQRIARRIAASDDYRRGISGSDSARRGSTGSDSGKGSITSTDGLN